MFKKLSLIILLILFLSQTALAAEETPKLLKACEDKLPKYTKIDLFKPYENEYNLNFRIAMEMARKNYHNYMDCVFNGATDEITGAGWWKAQTIGIEVGETLNLPDLNTPEVCKEEKELTNTVKASAPEVLIGPLLDTYYAYKAYLEELKTKLIHEAPVQGIDFVTAASQRRILMDMADNEIENSLGGLDGGLMGLKELRKAFVMHVHFMCMLKNLELYRSAIENLREVIMALPPIIQDASKH